MDLNSIRSQLQDLRDKLDTVRDVLGSGNLESKPFVDDLMKDCKSIHDFLSGQATEFVLSKGTTESELLLEELMESFERYNQVDTSYNEWSAKLMENEPDRPPPGYSEEGSRMESHPRPSSEATDGILSTNQNPKQEEPGSSTAQGFILAASGGMGIPSGSGNNLNNNNGGFQHTSIASAAAPGSKQFPPPVPPSDAINNGSSTKNTKKKVKKTKKKDTFDFPSTFEFPNTIESVPGVGSVSQSGSTGQTQSAGTAKPAGGNALETTSASFPPPLPPPGNLSGPPGMSGSLSTGPSAVAGSNGAGGSSAHPSGQPPSDWNPFPEPSSSAFPVPSSSAFPFDQQPGMAGGSGGAPSLSGNELGGGPGLGGGVVNNPTNVSLNSGGMGEGFPGQSSTPGPFGPPPLGGLGGTTVSKTVSTTPSGAVKCTMKLNGIRLSDIEQTLGIEVFSEIFKQSISQSVGIRPDRVKLLGVKSG